MLAIEMTVTEMVQVPVEDADIDEMFAYADKNCDGKLSYSEFEVTMECYTFERLALFWLGDGQSTATPRGA